MGTVMEAVAAALGGRHVQHDRREEGVERVAYRDHRVVTYRVRRERGHGSYYGFRVYQSERLIYGQAPYISRGKALSAGKRYVRHIGV